MKKSLLLLLTLVLVSPSLVSAQGDQNVTKRRPDSPSEVQIQAISQNRNQKVAENHAQRLEKRFNFYYSRLDNILRRFQERLDLLKAANQDTASVQAKLDLARQKLEAAKLKGTQAIGAFLAIEPARFAEQKTEAFAARDLAVAARKLYQEAHEALKLALKELKNISQPALPASSAAVQNANQ